MASTEPAQAPGANEFPIQLDVKKPTRSLFWFPHAPLAAFTAFIGLSETLPYLLGTSFFHVDLHAGQYLGESLLDISTLPHLYMGGILLVISVGLLFRLRLAYVTSIFILASSILINYLVPGHKLSIYQACLQLLLLAMLISARYSFAQANLTSSIFFSVASVSLVISYATLFSFEIGTQFSPPIMDLTAAFYFAMVTMSTVGFGDIVPVTTEARIFTISYVVLGLSVFATSFSTLIMPVLNSKARSFFMPDDPKIPDEGHLIVIGNSPLALNALKELNARNIPLVAIHPTEGTQLDKTALPPPPDDRKIPSLNGDPTDGDLLNKAHVQKAKAVLALTNNDALNVFIGLVVKDMNENTQTILAVNNPSHRHRVERVNPDVIVSADALTGELLAMALTGEKPDINTIWSKMFYLKDKH